MKHVKETFGKIKGCAIPSKQLEIVKEPSYLALGMMSEIVEVIDILGREEQRRDDILNEVGDVCWYVFALCDSLKELVPHPAKRFTHAVIDVPCLDIELR